MQNLVEGTDHAAAAPGAFEINLQLIALVTRELLDDILTTPAEDLLHDSVARVLRACVLHYQRRYRAEEAPV